MQGRVNSLMLAMASGFTWIGRGYADTTRQLVDLMQRAIQHPGLAYLDVLQPCPTYNNLHTRDWYVGKDRPDGQSRIYSVEDEGYDPVIPAGADQEFVFGKMCEFNEMAHQWDDRIPTGVLLENRSISTFEERIAGRIPTYRAAPPAHRAIADRNGRPLTDLSKIFAEMATMNLG
jgi:2-oxoglutarate ferredoxin oxidoreductase subunit beta